MKNILKLNSNACDKNSQILVTVGSWLNNDK
jgi:hypothetical protein